MDVFIMLLVALALVAAVAWFIDILSDNDDGFGY